LSNRKRSASRRRPASSSLIPDHLYSRALRESLSDDAPYWEALGRFMHQFSVTETQLFFLLTEQARVPPNIARAVFSDARADRAMDFIRRIEDSRETVADKQFRADIDAIFPQIKAINDARNAVVHNGGYRKDGTRVASNYLRALTPAKIRDFPVSPETLHAMTLDLMKIQVVLQLLINPGQQGRISATLRKHPALTAAWLYTPPQPKQTQERSADRQKRPERPKLPPPPPEPTQA